MATTIKSLTLALAATAASAGVAYGQSAVDAYNLSQTDLRGTARFVAMGGAFTSLGGDISSMTQNPAGIGVYRKSDIAVSMDFNFRRFGTDAATDKFSDHHNTVYFDNIGYVGTQRLDGVMRNFNWGVSYNRLNSFQRNFQGYNASTSTSMSNYIASFTQGVPAGDLNFGPDYNPYINSGADWMSILAYNTYMINNPGADDKKYQGLYVPGQTIGDAYYEMRDNGYVDEYNMEVGGNIADIVYWGLGLGVQDISYDSETYYNESMAGAAVVDPEKAGLHPGNAGFDLTNYKHIGGTGCNVKLGVIVRPVDALRIGLAVHTPTWYHLNHYGKGIVDYAYTPDGSIHTVSGSEYTDMFDYDSRLNTPWRLMAGVSTVLNGKAILSLDYEYDAYNDMSVKYQTVDRWGYANGFATDEAVNADIKSYYQGNHTVRLGLEYRLTKAWSLRAGYNYQTSNVTSAALDNQLDIATSGTDMSYTLNRHTQYVSAGAGFHIGGWYLDAAYQWRNRKGDYHPYTPYGSYADTPACSLTENIHSLTLTTGYRF